MATTVQQLADLFGVSADDFRALIAQYAGDVPLWEEAGVFTPEVGYELSRTLSSDGERTVQQ